FEQICQALAYAHARRVIHRDLKSSNVMVGAFGEVQVMDWGLAKVVPEAGGPTDVPSDTEPGTVIRSPQEEGGVEPTRYGSVLGTYAYMPPEQARGWVGEVDRRSDVFALGAILCDILTGKPPYPGPSRREMQIQAFEADLSGAFARLEACGADPELVALARHCLAPRKEERPANAGEVAAAVAAHQAAAQERLQAERLERERAQVKAAEERKRRRWQAGLAAAVLGLVVLTGGGWSWWRQQETLRRQGVEAALGRVSDHEARGEWGEARAALQEAAGRLGEGGPADLRERLARAESELALVAKLERIREDRAALVNGEFDHASAAPAYEAAFREAGLDVVAGEVTALAAAVRDSPIRAQLVAALDDWAMVAFAAGDADSRATCERLMRIARAADPDRDLRDRLRDPARWRDRQALKELARSAAGADVPPSLVTVLSSLMQGAGMPAEAEGVLREAQARYPDDFWVNFLLGNALNASRPAEAVGFYRAALAARPGSATAQNNLGIALSRLGDEPRAIRAYERAIELAPDYAVPWYNLAISRKAVGDPDGEIAAYRKALAISPDYARCRYNLGVALLARRDVDGAVECFRRASEHAGAALPAAEDGGPGKPLSARQAPFDLDLSAEGKDFEKE
ncbi:MAG TPA: tetratricopeptide repeat protein, partial [Gemmataceae bacterium]